MIDDGASHTLHLEVRLAVNLIDQLRRDVGNQVGLARVQSNQTGRGFGDRFHVRRWILLFGRCMSRRIRSPGQVSRAQDE